jgi:hypothetical protein
LPDAIGPAWLRSSFGYARAQRATSQKPQMKLPTFKPSKRFLGEFALPCLSARIKNSKLPGVAARHIAEYENDPLCKIYLRGTNPRKISTWQQEILEQLLVEEGLAPAIEQALKGYGKDPNAYCSEEERAEIRKYGFAPFIWISVIVIDEVNREVILSGGSEWSVHIPEHGLSIYLRKSRWCWDEADYFIRYRSTFEDGRPRTAAELAKARSKEIKAMASEFEALISGSEEAEKRWEKMFPATGSPVKTDASFLCGEWKLDPEKTAQVQTRMGENVSVAQCRKDWGKNVYHVTLDMISLHQGRDILTEERTQDCTRRGNRFTIRFLEECMEGTSEYWCDGKLLVDQTGLAYRRAG